MREPTYCRYIFTPCTAKRIGRRVTLMDRIRAWKCRREQMRNRADVFPVTGYWQ